MTGALILGEMPLILSIKNMKACLSLNNMNLVSLASKALSFDKLSISLPTSLHLFKALSLEMEISSFFWNKML